MNNMSMKGEWSTLNKTTKKDGYENNDFTSSSLAASDNLNDPFNF